MINLKPCPFCGGEAERFTIESEKPGRNNRMTGKFDFIKKQLSQNHSLIKFELERPSRRLAGDFSHRMAYLAGVEDVVKVLNSSWRRLRDELKLVKERQVEEIAKLVDEQAIRNAEKYRLALILARHNLRAISKAPLTISQAELVLMAKKAHDAVTNALKP